MPVEDGTTTIHLGRPDSAIEAAAQSFAMAQAAQWRADIDTLQVWVRRAHMIEEVLAVDPNIPHADLAIIRMRHAITGGRITAPLIQQLSSLQSGDPTEEARELSPLVFDTIPTLIRLMNEQCNHAVDTVHARHGVSMRLAAAAVPAGVPSPDASVGNPL